MDLEGVTYIDITPEISTDLDVFPGDTPFKRNVSFDMEKGDHLTLSSIESTLHLGAHTDAPNHYQKGGEGISVRSLDYYMGPCQVIDVSNIATFGGKIVSQDIKDIQINTSRVLFKTSSFQHNNWNNDFCALSEGLIKELAKQGVKLIGIDTPSIDLMESKDLKAHAAVSENNMAVLEGIDLNHVSEGEYQLISLPLKIKDADASPVRAILIPSS